MVTVAFTFALFDSFFFFHLQTLIEIRTQAQQDLLIQNGLQEELSEPPTVVSVVTVNTFPLSGRH